MAAPLVIGGDMQGYELDVRRFARRAVAVSLCLAGMAWGAQARVIEVKPVVPGGPSAFELIQSALNEARTARQSAPNEVFTLRLASGVYRLERPIIIEPRDSGRPQAPFIIEGAADGSTRIYGSVEATARPATPGDLAGKPQPPRPVQVIDLSSVAEKQPLGLVARGAYLGTPTSHFELFQGDTRFRPSSWPRTGYAENIAVRADPDSLGSRVKLPPSAFDRFRDETALQFGGYWIADWAYEAQSMTGVDISAGEFLVSRLVATLPVRRSVPLRVMNAMSVLEHPGSYVLDPAGKRAFVVPLTGAAPAFDLAVARELLVLATVQNVVVRNLAFERTLGTPIRVENASNITVENCLSRNTGNRGITVTGGRNVTIRRCVVADTAETAVLLSGGDRRQLSASKHALADSMIVRFGQDSPTYRPGAEIQGVGNSVTGSFFRDSAHSAIVLTGNEHRIADNEITDVVKETNDAGAIYMGRDFTARGNSFTGNYLHDIADPKGVRKAVIGIYLDDQFSGATITGNVFHRVNVPVQIGGGRDTLVEGNAFLAPQRAAVLFDDRGTNKQRAMVLTGELNTKLQAMPFRQPLWAARYPALAELPEKQIGVPLNNIVRRNVMLGRTVIEYETASSRPYLGATETIQVQAPAAAGANASAADLLGALAQADPAVAGLNLVLAERAKALRDLPFGSAAAPQPEPK